MNLVQNCNHYTWTLIQDVPPDNSFVRVSVVPQAKLKGDGRYPDSVFWYAYEALMHDADIWDVDQRTHQDNTRNCTLLQCYGFTHYFRPLWMRELEPRKRYLVHVGRPVCRRSPQANLQERIRNP